MVPIVDGQVHHFRVVGLYNGLAIMADDETGTYWDHITGEAYHGQHQGKVLGFREHLQYMTAEQVLENYPHAQTAQEISIRMRLLAPLLGRMLGTKGQLIPPFWKSMPTEDKRRPRLEVGVGLWTTQDDDATYYPLATLKHQGYVLTSLAERGVLIYIDPISKTPDAIYFEGQVVGWNGASLCLSNNQTIHHKILRDGDGKISPVERPHYLLTRWYGFALTFPQCQIFE